MGEHPWDKAKREAKAKGKKIPPEPGTVLHKDHGIPGPPEELPEDDKQQDEPTAVNDD